MAFRYQYYRADRIGILQLPKHVIVLGPALALGLKSTLQLPYSISEQLMRFELVGARVGENGT